MQKRWQQWKLANDGVDTRTIQSYLGHKSIQHTVRYTELAPTRFKSLFRDGPAQARMQAGQSLQHVNYRAGLARGLQPLTPYLEKPTKPMFGIETREPVAA